jgi:hypothetical protein
VLKHKPQLVTIMFGMNDLTAFPIAKFKDNLAEMSKRCRDIGAEVLLCTQNSVIETGGRPNKKLAEFTAAIREVGREQKIPVVDCHKAYEAIRAKDVQEWSLLLSDEIHPNMDGHKLFARLIAQAVTGKDDALKDVGPPAPAIPKTLGLLKAGKVIKVLAMPPYDKAFLAALKEVDASAKVEMTTWPVEGQTLAEIEKAAKKVRGMGMDLVIVAVPAGARADTTERLIRSYSWVLNWSLSFAHQQWDVIALPPSTAKAELSAEERGRDQLARRLIAAQDLSMVVRDVNDRAAVQELLVRWLMGQTNK